MQLGEPGTGDAPKNSDGDAEGAVGDSTGGDARCAPVEGPAYGPRCADGIDDDCDGATDLADDDCANTPPVASFHVVPPSPLANESASLKASASDDREDATNALTFAWDLDADGAFETPSSWAPLPHVFALPGRVPVVLRVTDTGGLSDVVDRTIEVLSDDAAVLVVDTGLDAVDPSDGALSLREAIEQVNASSPTSVPTIRVDPAVRRIDLVDALPFLERAGMRLYGHPLLTIAASTFTGDCLSIQATKVRVSTIALHDCPENAIKILPTAVDAEIDHVTVLRAGDDAIDFESGEGHTVHHCTLIDSTSDGVVMSQGITGVTRLADNLIIRSGDGGLMLRSGTPIVERNVLVANYDGIGLGLTDSAVTDAVIRHNTIHANLDDGIDIDAFPSAGHDIRNNLITENGSWGLDVGGGSLTHFDGNGFAGNVDGACLGCTAAQVVRSCNPAYVDAAGRDYRLGPSSTCIDAGVITPTDVNGVRPGTHQGEAPDIGAWESPSP